MDDERDPATVDGLLLGVEGGHDPRQHGSGFRDDALVLRVCVHTSIISGGSDRTRICLNHAVR
jgi:hypothetical protein